MTAHMILAHGGGDLAAFVLLVAPAALLLGLGIMLIFPSLGAGYAQRRYEDLKVDESESPPKNGNGGPSHVTVEEAAEAEQAVGHRRGNGSEARRRMYGGDPDA